jgi:hypothetical protein
MNWRDELRQLSFPAEFRIPEPEWPVEALAFIQELLKATGSSPAKPPDRPKQEEKSEKFYLELGMSLWRLRQKMVAPGTEEPREEMRRAWRHLESALETLAQEGVEVQDHDGMVFSPGMSLRVIAFQPTPGYRQETVIETVLPSIYHHNRLIQMGEVIVASPDESSPAAASASA